MLKHHLIVFTVICLFFAIPSSFAAPYDRNQAVPVEKVEFGQVISVRNITEKQLVEDRNTGWKTFGGALIGGVIGHQFGGGSGQDVATVLGALLGAGVANRYGDSSYYQELRLVEMMIALDTGEQVMVLQDLDPGMIFNVNDEVRVVYLRGYVRVDRQM
ncbi:MULTISPECIES: glycine zipper 2TM domain-containing protein [unclassified Shewanella]|uniref:glycine zipper 2TM domain-containing protein n=1 Tax=unclassified Shewanella TaxID=196818 RepID=UPI001BBF74BD|nr:MULTISPECIES: glycine zipper 2TM domain-containing protein [unclassified Shewanella]MCG9731692.1 glycine zipper 2TM domain-containing protein [Shewanella sp. Isolate13]GIU24254.1 membrane protein [Shewanella sp. MBTL60-007]